MCNERTRKDDRDSFLEALEIKLIGTKPTEEGHEVICGESVDEKLKKDMTN